jgi:hypothetical protein
VKPTIAKRRDMIKRGMRGKHLNGVSFPLKLPLTLPNNYIIDFVIE